MTACARMLKKHCFKPKLRQLHATNLPKCQVFPKSKIRSEQALNTNSPHFWELSTPPLYSPGGSGWGGLMLQSWAPQTHLLPSRRCRNIERETGGKDAGNLWINRFHRNPSILILLVLKQTQYLVLSNHQQKKMLNYKPIFAGRALLAGGIVLHVLTEGSTRNMHGWPLCPHAQFLAPLSPHARPCNPWTLLIFSSQTQAQFHTVRGKYWDLTCPNDLNVFKFCLTLWDRLIFFYPREGRRQH